MSQSDDIAIVGRACRLPGAASVADLWTLLAAGRCAVTQIPADRWNLQRMLHPRGAERGKTYTWAAGTLDDIWGFDPGAFGLSPREAEQMDPQQRLMLELSWEALEDAGIRPSTIAGSEAGVFVGAAALDHANLRVLDVASADAYMMTGNTLSIVSNRLSYVYDLHGPSFTVDTACSSALVALNEAVVNLRSGRIDTAIVGGVNILATPHSFVGFSQASMLSRRGLCQAFSAAADGYVRAEGGVVLILQTREAAKRAGHHVHAFVTGSDVNSDGRTNGISLPSKAFQARLLERLYLDEGVDLDRLAFIEAHGTGTPVGDPIEATAIGETLAQRRTDPLLIGSVKTNIGHMEAASGLAGVLKAMLALENDELPASLHSETLNPHIDFGALNLEVARQATALPRRPGRPRFAGINSFGFGGTNAHVVITDGSPATKRPIDTKPSYLILSAHSRSALRALVADYATRTRDAGEAETLALVAASAHRRDRLPHRVVMPIDRVGDLAATLDRLGDEDAEVTTAASGTAIDREIPVAFVFSGNGSQFAGMGLAAYARNATFRARIDQISSDFADIAGWSIVDALHDDDLATKLGDTQIAQPLLFAIQSATAHALRRGGLEPAVVFGHSVGEVAAAEAAGILDNANALKTIFHRSKHQALTHDTGRMAVLIGAQDAVEAILAELPDLSVAAVNSPRAVTVSGTKEDVDRLPDLARRHAARIRKLDLAYPFHSALMAPVQRPLLDSLADLVHGSSAIPFVSTVTGSVESGASLDAHYWWRNVRDPVRFSTAVTSAVAAGARIFVEIGPSASLLTHINDTIDERAARIATIAGMEKRDKGVDPIAMAIATAIMRGAKVDETKVFGTPPRHTIALPHYPWQRKPFRLAETQEAPTSIKASAWHPLVGARFTPDRLEWHSSLDTTLYPSLADHCVDGRAILPGAAFAEMALAVARDWLGQDAATIADLEITSPMQLTPEASREVVCRLSPLTNHLEIASRPRLGQTPWQIHATAKILHDSSTGTLPEANDHAPLSPSHPVTGAEIYAMADRAGLQYGPTFRKLETASAVRPDRIVLELTKDEADPAFGIDPARLDSCFHALVLIFSSLRDAVHGTAYVPVRFGEIILRKPSKTFVKARIDVLRRDDRIILANFLLTDKDGEIVVFIREARFQAIRTSRAIDSVRQMIYRTSILACEPTATRITRPLSLATFRPRTSSDTTSMADDFVLLDGWATSVGLQTARELATANFIDVDALVTTGRLPAKLRPWLEDMLVSLERSGLCHKDRIGRHIDPDIDLPNADEILQTIASEHQSLSAELLVAASAATTIRDIVAGDFDGMRRPLKPKVLDALELGGSTVHACAAYLIDLVRASIPAWPRDRAMRILQVGFGPLSTLLVALGETHQTRLTIFDPDRRRLERAKIGFADHGEIDFIDKLDDIEPDGYDFVLAAEALYRHRRFPGLWQALRRGMASGAIFAAVEPSPSFFRDLAFGLDARLADTGPTFDGRSVNEADWLDLLQAVGLSDAQVAPVRTSQGTALLLTAQADIGRRIRSSTGSVVIVGAGDPDASQSASALATLFASSGVHVSILSETEAIADVSTEAPTSIVVLACGRDPHVAPAKRLVDQCMSLKGIMTGLDRHKTTLWLVTSASTDGTDRSAAAVASGLWAFSRTLANERPNLEVRRVDVAADMSPDPLAERLRDLVLAETDETEIVLDMESTRVVRFECGSTHDRAQGGRVEAGRLRRGEGAGIDRIAWEAVGRQPPGPHDVEISVEAVGLNFRDVMFGLGLLPEDILEHGFAGATLGLECAGRIDRVGSAVRGLKPGDRVMAFAKNAFSTHVTTPAAVVSPIPQGLSYETAATIPVAFMTAYHALMICARLKPQEWVLIHGGAGGVGLAAIQIARWRGARVIATAGSDERRALLRSLGAEHAFESRTGAFVEDVRRVTGDGVAVVMNSLSGEAMERSIACLRPFGRFVELGKRDYVANTHIGLRPFRRNLSYFGVDLDQLLLDDPATSKLLMRSVTRLFANSELHPLPYRAFDAGETVEAFRLMQQSGHIGKLVVRPPKLGDITARARRNFMISPDKLHVVTGGFGGFGLETARWLASKGARNLMLIGRSGAADPAAREAVAALSAEGIRVRAESLDVADKEALTRLFTRFGKDLPPLAGIVHAAMVLDDATIDGLTPDKMRNVLRPKVTGADNLDQLTRDLKLDYFVLYSSATTLIGNPGQAAYVAANGYLEGLARARRQAGLPGLAVAWGAIEDVGVLARSDATREALINRVGLKGMLAQDALRLMNEVLASPSTSPDDAVVVIAPVNWSAARQHLPLLQAPAYRRLSSQAETSASDEAKIDIAALVARNAPDDARKIIGGLIVDEIARVLRLPKDDVSKTTPLSEIGLDSLMAVELAMGLDERFLLKAPLSTTAGSFTVNELADHVIGLATGSLSADAAIEKAMVERHLGPAADAIENLEKTAEAVREQTHMLKGLLN